MTARAWLYGLMATMAAADAEAPKARPLPTRSERAARIVEQRRAQEAEAALVGPAPCDGCYRDRFGSRPTACSSLLLYASGASEVRWQAVLRIDASATIHVRIFGGECGEREAV